MHFTRRLSIASFVLTVGCGNDPAPAAPSGDAGPVTPDASALDASVKVDTGSSFDALRPPMIARTETDTALETRRRGCMFMRGAWPAETLGTDVPIGDAIPLRHILVLMQENRSFDHYFAKLKDRVQTDVEAPPADWSNPQRDGTRVRPMRDTTYCITDVSHSWNGSQRQYNNGAMDGFVTTNNPEGERAMAYLEEADLPFYYDLAGAFAIADHYHASLLGPTMPNRFYMMGASSYGLIHNRLVLPDTRATPVDNLYLRLEAAGLDWKDYAGGARPLGLFPYFGIQRLETRPHLATLDQLTEDLRTGNLPPFATINPSFSGTGGDRVDEHPPGMPQMGSRWVESIVRAVMASPAWPHTALIITYDEHGGFADHVPPPAACAPGDYEPTRDSDDLPGRFDRLGFRVPFIVVSPYAKRHYVSHRVYDHSSVVRFVEARFGLPAMTSRDANATPIHDLFDFTRAPDTSVPNLRPSAVPAEAQARCRATWPSVSAF
jgi:phospholipase C